MFTWKRVRYGVMFGFLAYITWVGYQHQVLGGGPAGVPTVDALCPFGGLEGIYNFLASGTWLRRLAPSALILFAAVAAITLLLGRVFCGWICPLGSIGEFSALASRKLGIKRRELPPILDGYLKMLKYVILSVILYYTWTLGTLAWRSYDPWMAWMHLSAGWQEFIDNPWAFAALFGLVIGAGLFIERFWCRYLCPLGAALAVFQKLSFTKVVRSADTCISCGKCNKACPMGLAPMSVEKVTGADCIACGRCTENCPVDKTLVFSFAGRKTLSALALGVIGVLLFFGAYGTAKTAGYWQTFASTSSEALRDPVEGIFGWMTIDEAARQVKLPPEKVLEIGRLPAGTPLDMPLKKIEGVNDEILKEDIKAYFAANPAQAPKPVKAVPANPDELKGSFTLDEVAAGYGLDGAEILREAGWPAGTPGNISIKQAGEPLGREPADIREAVKKLLKDRR